MATTSNHENIHQEPQQQQLYPSTHSRSPNRSNGSTPELLSERIEQMMDHRHDHHQRHHNHQDNSSNNNQQQRQQQNHHQRPRNNPIKTMTELPWLVNNDTSSKSSSPNSFLEGGTGSPFTDYYNTLSNQSPTTSTSQTQTKYDWRLHSLMLCRHIFTRGLIDGIGSDISVHVPAWGKVYNLHRVILDQNPYFSSLLQGGFQESSSDNVTLHFENNPFITDESFYFVLTQLYGKLYDPDIHQDNVRQILATCSFFQLEHMGDLCVQFILQTLDEENVIQYLSFADEYVVYGSDRILNAVFTYLCREMYSMKLETVAQLPVHWLKKIIESDAFWVPR